jgi:hypothetical protein
VSEWGPWCGKCGHPASYHTTTRCQCDAGASTKARCDCDGYTPTTPDPARYLDLDSPDAERRLAAALEKTYHGSFPLANGDDWLSDAGYVLAALRKP